MNNFSNYFPNNSNSSCKALMSTIITLLSIKDEFSFNLRWHCLFTYHRYVRCCVQGQAQKDWKDCRSEEDSTGERRGGGTQHRHQRNLTTKRALSSKYCFVSCPCINLDSYLFLVLLQEELSGKSKIRGKV